ncbi:MAG: hypothetical protein IKV14_06600 [Muribaculaceae bacterium]|nr:hypothetical protein [Muribaculaceae bacterium]
MAENEKIEELKEEIISLEQSDDTTSDVVSQEQEEETNIEEEGSATEEDKKNKKKEKRERKNILKSIWNIIKTIFMGRILSVDFIIRYWKTILTALFISLFYISNRYACQQSAARIKRVESEIVEIRYKSLGMFTRLKTLQREDSIAKLIRESNLKLEIPKHPPYTINAIKENGKE